MKWCWWAEEWWVLIYIKIPRRCVIKQEALILLCPSCNPGVGLRGRENYARKTLYSVFDSCQTSQEMVTDIREHQRSLKYPSFRANLHCRGVLQFTMHLCFDLIYCFHWFCLPCHLLWPWTSWRQSHVIFIFVWPMYAWPIVGSYDRLKVAANSLTTLIKWCSLFLLSLNLDWPVTALTNWVEWKWHDASSKPSLKEKLVLLRTKHSYPTGQSLWGPRGERDEPKWSQPSSHPCQSIRAILNYPGRSATNWMSQRTSAGSTWSRRITQLSPA